MRRSINVKSNPASDTPSTGASRAPFPSGTFHGLSAANGQMPRMRRAGIVSGTEVRNSLLFTGVRTHSYSSLDHVVALPYVTVNRNALLKNCVIDRGVVIPDGLVVGEDPVADAKWFRRTDSGIVLVTQSMLDARAARLG